MSLRQRRRLLELSSNRDEERLRLLSLSGMENAGSNDEEEEPPTQQRSAFMNFADTSDDDDDDDDDDEEEEDHEEEKRDDGDGKHSGSAGDDDDNTTDVGLPPREGVTSHDAPRIGTPVTIAVATSGRRPQAVPGTTPVNTVLKPAAPPSTYGQACANTTDHNSVIDDFRSGISAVRLLDELLRPSERHLNADAEVLRILGPGATAGAGGGGGGPLRRGGGAHGGWQPVRGGHGQAGGAGRRKTRYVMVSPEPTWVAPPSRGAGGFSILQTPGSSDSFAFMCSSDYEAAQSRFEAVVAAHDPNLVTDFLAHVPYHIDALLAVADLQRLRGQHEAAGVSVRQAAFVVESALPPSFRPWDAPCRMDITPSYGGNRGNSICGRVWWRLMQTAGRSGAPRTALELAKLLLQCSPPNAHGGDPLRVLLALDYYALRAGEPRFVVALTGCALHCAAAYSSTCSQPPHSAPVLTLRGSDVPAVALPSILFSRALALFMIECEAAAGGNQPERGTLDAARATTTSTTTSIQCASGDASSTSSDTPSSGMLQNLYTDMSVVSYGATRTLVRALLLFPHALLPLLTEGLSIRATDTGVGTAGNSASGGGSSARHAGGARPTPPITPASSCVWKPVFRHPLFAGPFAEYATIRRRGWEAWGGAEQEEEDEDEELVAAEGAEAAHGGPTAETAAPAAHGDTTVSRRRAAAVVVTPTGWTPALEKLVSVFVTRHASLWRSHDRVGWLYTAARVAMAATDASRALESGVSYEDVDLVLASTFTSTDEAAAEAFSAAAARRSLYAPTLRRNAGSRASGDDVENQRAASAAAAIHHYCGAVVSEYSDDITTIAAELLDGDGAPEDVEQFHAHDAPRPDGFWIGVSTTRPLDLTSRHVSAPPLAVLRLFLESLLPWVVIPGAPPVRDPLRGL